MWMNKRALSVCICACACVCVYVFVGGGCHAAYGYIACGGTEADAGKKRVKSN